MSYESLAQQYALKPILSTEEYERAKVMFDELWQADLDEDDKSYLEVLALLLDAYELEHGIDSECACEGDEETMGLEEYKDTVASLIETAKEELTDEEYQDLLREISVNLSTAMYPE